MSDNHPLAKTYTAYLENPQTKFKLAESELYVEDGKLIHTSGVIMAMRYTLGGKPTELRAVGFFPPAPDDKTQIIYCANVAENPETDENHRINAYGYTNLLKETASEILTCTDERQISEMMKYIGHVRKFADDYFAAFGCPEKFVVPDEVEACETYAAMTIGDKAST